jgi:hypothetical protein
VTQLLEPLRVVCGGGPQIPESPGALVAYVRSVIVETRKQRDQFAEDLGTMVTTLGDLGSMTGDSRSPANVVSRIAAMTRDYRTTLASHAVAMGSIRKAAGVPEETPPMAVAQVVTAALKAAPRESAEPSSQASVSGLIGSVLGKLDAVLDDVDTWAAALVKDAKK